MLDESKIVEEFREGKLLSRIFDGFGQDDEGDALVARIVELHNTGQINILQILDAPELNEISGAQFFVGQHFYCRTIPLLKDDATNVMKGICVLVAKGGDDMAAGQPNAAFREWCTVDLSRSQSVIEGAKLDDPRSLKCLTFALEAHCLHEEAAEFAENDDGPRQQAGVVALGRMELRDRKSIERAISAIHKAVEGDADEFLRSNALMSSLRIVENNDDAEIADVTQLISSLCTPSGDQFHYCCAQALYFHVSVLDRATIEMLLHTLRDLNFANKGTVRELDNGLRAILETEHDEAAIYFIENLLRSNSEGFSWSEFERFSRGLINGPMERFSKVFVSWLLSGEQLLCEGLSFALRGSEAAEKEISLSFADFEFTSDQFAFVCRKTIGYFFVQSVFVGSVITSILRICDKETSVKIGRLLYDPMLINFGGALREYLEAIDADDAAHRPVKAALSDAKKYLDGLKSVGWIKEIVPSEREKLMEQQRFSDQMRDAYKEAEKKSIFFDLVSRSVLLYGKGSVTFVEGPDGERKPIETEMKSFSTSMELPRQEIVDPVGLDLMLRTFRVERLKK